MKGQLPFDDFVEEHELRVAALEENARLRKIIQLYERYVELLEALDGLERED